MWRYGISHHSPDHRWYYFPDFAADELLLFKAYDTDRDYNIVHAAFDNRRAYLNANARESFEARFFVSYY